MNRKADGDGSDMVENEVLVFSTVPEQMQKEKCPKKLRLKNSSRENHLICCLSTDELLRVVSLWPFVGFDAVRNW